jgi:hypothetical protein
VVTSASVVPGRASRQCSMSSTTSRVISRSWSNASASRVKLTMPSIEFSIGTNPASTCPEVTASSTSGTVRWATSSRPTRSGWVRNACSVKVPNGPKKAILPAPAVPTSPATPVETPVAASLVDASLAMGAKVTGLAACAVWTNQRCAPSSTASVPGDSDSRRRRCPTRSPAVRRPRRRPRRPSPCAAPGDARGRVRPWQVGGAVRAHRRGAARPTATVRCCSPALTTIR